jgi:hypothetical protein
VIGTPFQRSIFWFKVWHEVRPSTYSKNIYESSNLGEIHREIKWRYAAIFKGSKVISKRDFWHLQINQKNISKIILGT